MSIQVKDVFPKENFKKVTAQVGEQLAYAGMEVDRMKVKMAQAVDDGVDAARKAVKRSRHAAEDMIDETAYKIKHDPLQSVAITFGIGLGLGVLIGWILGREKK